MTNHYTLTPDDFVAQWRGDHTPPDPKTPADIARHNLRVRAFLVARELGDWTQWAQQTGDAELIARVALVQAALADVREHVQQEARHA